jgi:hypothetical protein
MAHRFARFSRRSVLGAALGSVLFACGCGTSPGGGKEAADSKAAPGSATLAVVDGELPKLRTGTRAPKKLDAVVATVRARFDAKAGAQDGGAYLELELPDRVGSGSGTRVHVDGALAAMDGQKVLIRWPRNADVPGEVSGTVYGSEPGDRWRDPPTFLALPFTVAASTKPDADGGLPARWVGAFAVPSTGAVFTNEGLGFVSSTHPFCSFAAGRISAAVLGRKRAQQVVVDDAGRRRGTELSEVMDTTTASVSIQEALQHERGLRLRGGADKPTIPISQLERVPLRDHPFEQMRAKLPDPDGARPEPLAELAPVGFWYVRFSDIRLMLRVLDEADAWITPAAHILQEDPSVRDLSGRYQAQLGLRRTGLAKVLGHTVVDGVAAVGSDPYLREGSDVTLLFSVTNTNAFEAELTRHMDAYRESVPGIERVVERHRGVDISIQRDPAGRVRQHRATLGKVHVVSNSGQAIRRVIDVSKAGAASIAASPDFAYMLARDPQESDALGFLSDRFIAAVISPEQKILQSRRQHALAELLVPGYAALTYGWLHGKEPSRTRELISVGLLDEQELTHGDGGRIDFVPGKSARSSWGEPAMLTPLLDLPPVTTVTEQEKRAFEAFAAGYQRNWTQFIDPVAIRLDIEGEGDAQVAHVEVRVLPLIEGTEYNEILDVVGDTRVKVPELSEGARAVWAVGDTDLRRELNGMARMLGGGEKVGIDWLGDWVMLGSLDRAAVLEMAELEHLGVQLPEERGLDREAHDLEMARRVGRLPLYAAADVRNPAGLVAALAGLRTALNGVAPGMVTWGEHKRHGEVPIVRVGISPTAPDEGARQFAEAVALYYAQAGGVIVLALDLGVLEALIDRILGGNVPDAGQEDDPQFVLATRTRAGRAIWTGILWMLQGQANGAQKRARAAAEAILRGIPSAAKDARRFRETSLAYLGSVPVSASGRSDFTLEPDGVHDSVHGSQVTPTYPELPVEGSPLAILMQRLVGVQAEVSFDREPVTGQEDARSLHTVFELRLGSAGAP